MEFHYQDYRSRLMDILFFPIMKKSLLKEQLDVMQASEVEAVQDVLEISEQFIGLLQPYQKRIEKYFLKVGISHLPEIIYRHLLEEGQDPKDLEELLALFEACSAQTIQDLVLGLLSKEERKKPLEEVDLVSLLEQQEITDAERWRFNWAFHHPMELIQGLCALYRDLYPLYQPFMEKYQKEVTDFARIVDLEALYQDSEFDVMGMLYNTQKTDCQLFVLSPWYIFNIITYDPDKDSPAYFYIYPRVAHFLKTRSKLTDKSVRLMLKSLSDENRYQVLRELAKEDAKSKDIAENLGITAANVSFHTQKLVNAQLLFFNTDPGSNNKYRLNKPALKMLLEQVAEDFDLKE
ncbi:ArsR family transcriptional regulator [Streptococcus cameli]